MTNANRVESLRHSLIFDCYNEEICELCRKTILRGMMYAPGFTCNSSYCDRATDKWLKEEWNGE